MDVMKTKRGGARLAMSAAALVQLGGGERPTSDETMVDEEAARSPQTPGEGDSTCRAGWLFADVRRDRDHAQAEVGHEPSSAEHNSHPGNPSAHGVPRLSTVLRRRPRHSLSAPQCCPKIGAVECSWASVHPRRCRMDWMRRAGSGWAARSAGDPRMRVVGCPGCLLERTRAVLVRRRETPGTAAWESRQARRLSRNDHSRWTARMIGCEITWSGQSRAPEAMQDD